jgi:hypothetical protein
VSPLDKIAAHQANYGAIPLKTGFYGLNLFSVPQVKGVIFAYDADGSQNINAFSQIFLFQGLSI